MRDPYDILGVDRSDDAETIKRAYRRLAFRYHPDRNPGDPDAAQRFRDVCEAYEQIDPHGRAGSGAGSSVSWPDVGLETLARAIDAFHRGWRPDGAPPAERPRDGRDRRVSAPVTFEESVTGTHVEVEYTVRRPCERCQGLGGADDTHWQECPDCGGRGEVRKGLFGLGERVVCTACCGRGRQADTWCAVCRGRGVTERTVTDTIEIPPGIADGQSFILEGRGEPGLRGGEPGDLIIDVDVRDSDEFSRRGRDVITEVEVPFSVAVLGGEVRLPTPTGCVVMDIPEGTSDGQRFRLKGRGFPADSARQAPEPSSPAAEHPRRGHLIAVVRVEGRHDPAHDGVQVRRRGSWRQRVTDALRQVVGKPTRGE